MVVRRMEVVLLLILLRLVDVRAVFMLYTVL